MTDQNPQGEPQDIEDPIPSNDTDESGAGYGNHGDADQGSVAGSGSDEAKTD